MRVRDIMIKDVYTIQPNATIRDAAKLFIRTKVTGFIVVDERKQIVGVLSDKDLYRGLYPRYQDFISSPEAYTDFAKQEIRISEMATTPIRTLMSRKVIVAHPDDYVMKAGALMLARNVHRFPVVDTKGNLIGTVSRGHIYRSLFKKHFRLSK